MTEYIGEPDPYREELEDMELCDYTGELCCGDKLFCEECPVMTDFYIK